MNIANNLKDLVISAMKSQYGVTALRKDLITEMVVPTDPVNNIYCIYDIYTNDTNGFRVRLYCTSDAQPGLSTVELDRVPANNPNDGRSFLFASAQLNVHEVGVITGTGCPPAITVLPTTPVILSNTADINGTVTLNGTATINISLQVRWVDDTISTISAGSDGTWQAVSPPGQEDGVINVHATDMDGLNSAVLTYTYNDAPDTPAIISDTDLPSGLVTVEGTSENNITIIVGWLSGGATSVTSDLVGAWSSTSPVQQPTGTLSAHAEDEGKISGTIGYGYIAVPNRPVVTADSADALRLVTLAGTSDNNSIIDVTWPDTSTASTVAPGGNWTLVSAMAQADGDILLTATDPTGTKTSAEITYSYLAAPAAPVIISDTEEATGQVSITGTAEALSAITISWPLGSDTTTTSSGTGDWTSINVAQIDGDITASATAHGKTSETVTYAYDAPPSAPVVTGDTADVDELATITGTSDPDTVIVVTWADSTTSQVAANGAGAWSASSTAEMPTGNIVVNATINGKTSDDTTYAYHHKPPAPVVSSDTVNGIGIVTLLGTAEIGSVVSVSWNAGVATTNTTDAVGNWSVVSTVDQVNGDIDVTATAHGKTSPAATYSYVDTPHAPVVNTRTVDGVGLVTLDGTADINNTIVVTWPDATETTTASDGTGVWSATSATSIPDGDINITAELGGKVSVPAIYVNDGTAPVNPVVINHVDNAGLITLTGTAEANSEVVVTFPTGTAVTVTVDIAGNWTAVDTIVQSVDGDATITATDSSGNVSGTTTYTLDVTAPNAPIISSYSLATNKIVTLIGTSEADSSVTVTWPTGSNTQATTDGNGDWISSSAVAQLTDGDITATASDAFNNVSLTTTLAIDVVAPSAPVVTSHSVDGSGLVTLLGTAEANSTIDVMWTDGTDTTVTTDGTGNWSATSANDITSGDVLVVSTDVAGNDSDEVTYVYDETPPVLPVITGTTDANNGLITIIGTAEANSTIDVTWTDATTTQTTAGASGDWTSTSSTVQANGNMAITATDASDNVSPATAYVLVDTFNPNAPVVTNSVADAGQLVTVVGTAEPGSTVHVAFTAGSQDEIADNVGDWTITSISPEYTTTNLSVTCTDVNGNDSIATSHTYTDVTSPNAPVITSTATDGAGDVTIVGTAEINTVIDITWPDASTSQVSVDNSGDWTVVASGKSTGTVSIIATDAAGNISTAVTTTIDTDAPDSPVVASHSTDGSGAVTLIGTAEINSVIDITWPDASVTQATTDGSGDWTSTSVNGMEDGDVTITATDGESNVSTVTTYVYDNTPPAAPEIDEHSDEGGGLIRIEGISEASAVIDVTWPTGSATQVTANASGDWFSTSLVAQIADGDITATATDSSGNVSTAVTYTLDVTAPDAPVVTSKSQDVDGKPTLVGTGEIGATVNVDWLEGVSGTVVVDSNGDWTLSSNTVHNSSGDMNITVTDVNGNTSAALVYAFADTTIPLLPVVDNTDITGGTVQLSGNANNGVPGETVTVTWPDTSVDTGVVNSSGAWSVSSSVVQVSGDATVILSDTSGNTGPALTHAFVVASSQTATPVVTSHLVGGGGLLTLTGTSVEDSTIYIDWIDGADTQVSTDQGSSDWTATSPEAQTSGDISVTALFGALAMSNPVVYPIDLLAPAAPIVTSATPDGNGAITLVGTAEANAVIDIIWPDDTETDITADGSGDWTATSADGMEDGDITVTATDAAGNTSGDTIYVLDTVAPAMPGFSFTIDANGAMVLSGTSDNGSNTINVTWPDATTDTTAMGGGGAWTITSADNMADGTVSVTATDTAGNTSSVNTLSYDGTAPDAPVIVSVTPDSNGAITAVVTGEANADINLVFPDGSVFAWHMSGAGNYSATSSDNMISGNVTAQLTDASSNVSPLTTYVYDVNSPVVTTAGPGPGGAISLTGTSEANATVDIIWPDASTSQTTADGSGDWVQGSGPGVGDGNITLTGTVGGVISEPTLYVYQS